MNLYIPEYQRYADDRYRDAFETKEPIRGKIYLRRKDAEFEGNGYVAVSDHLSYEIVILHVVWPWERFFYGISCWLYRITHRIKLPPRTYPNP